MSQAYQLVLHGVGWRHEQEEDAEAPLGWRTTRQLPADAEGEVEQGEDLEVEEGGLEDGGATQE